MANTSPTDLSWLWAIIGAAATQTLNWVFSRRKEAKELAKVEAEAHGSEIDNVEKAIKIWRGLADEMKAQVVELKAQINFLSDEVVKLKIENTTLKQQVNQLVEENKQLMKKLES